jgi:hypothetical protein
MKTVILTTILSLTVILNSAFAANKVTTNYTGESKMSLHYSKLSIFGMPYSASSVVTLDIKAEVTELETGRATIRLTSNEIKQCAGFSTIIYAEQDGFGVYDLYANKEAWTNGEKLGTAIKKNSSLQISFSNENFRLTTLGRKLTDCRFILGDNFYTELSLNK